MSVIELRDAASGSTARIAAHLGFNCFDFQAALPDGRRVSVIDAADGFEDGGHPVSHSGIPLLFPYPNRIRSGRFTWEGRDYHLPEGAVAYEGNGNAIHGFCLDRPWRVTATSDASATGEFCLSQDAPDRLPLWPADFRIAVRCSLNGPRLVTDITVTNPSDVVLPWGFGTHAYFRLPLQPDSEAAQCTVQAPVSRRWELEDFIPTGRQSELGTDTLANPVRYGGLKLDDVLTGVAADDSGFACRITDPQAGLQVVQTCDAAFRDVVAFTPPWTTAVCLEPYTCVTDAINLHQRGVDAGLRLLPPGESWTGCIVIEVRTVGG